MADTNSNPDELKSEGAVQTDEVHDTKTEQSEGTEQDQADHQDANSEGTEGEKSSETTEQSTNEGSEETLFFDPKDIPEDLPADQRERLINTHKRMQAAFTSKTQAVAEAKRQVEEAAAKAGKPSEQQIQDQAKEQGQSIVSQVLKTRGIDETKLNDDQKAFLSIIEEVATSASAKAIRTSVTPLYEQQTAAQVTSWFKANPDAAKYRSKMAEIDRRTSERLPDGSLKPKLSLDELLVLASKEEQGYRKTDEDSRTAGKKRLNNSESSGSTASGTPAGNDPFKKMLENNPRMPF